MSGDWQSVLPRVVLPAMVVRVLFTVLLVSLLLKPAVGFLWFHLAPLWYHVVTWGGAAVLFVLFWLDRRDDGEVGKRVIVIHATLATALLMACVALWRLELLSFLGGAGVAAAILEGTGFLRHRPALKCLVQTVAGAIASAALRFAGY